MFNDYGLVECSQGISAKGGRGSEALGVLLQCQVNAQLVPVELHLVRQWVLSVIPAVLSCNMNLHSNNLLKYNFEAIRPVESRCSYQETKWMSLCKRPAFTSCRYLSAVQGPATASSLLCLCLLTFSSTFPRHLRRR